MIKVPKYIVEAMERSTFEFDLYKKHQDYAPGYTISIRKASAYTKIETLKSEIERICKWANKIGGEGTAILLGIPSSTHYCTQCATVTIFDPAMIYLEKFIHK